MTSEPKELRGRDAEAYAEEHLDQVKVDPETWEVEYVDPETDRRWLMDYPNGEAQGGGVPRLRLIDQIESNVSAQQTPVRITIIFEASYEKFKAVDLVEMISAMLGNDPGIRIQMEQGGESSFRSPDSSNKAESV